MIIIYNYILCSIAVRTTITRTQLDLHAKEKLSTQRIRKVLSPLLGDAHLYTVMRRLRSLVTTRWAAWSAAIGRAEQRELGERARAELKAQPMHALLCGNARRAWALQLRRLLRRVGALCGGIEPSARSATLVVANAGGSEEECGSGSGGGSGSRALRFFYY